MKSKLTIAKYSHVFTVTVITSGSRKSAEFDLLAAFARRMPDDCEFHLSRKKPTLTRCVQRKAK